ncbi:GNAT family N-acetyltransferase [Longirhabdus pacifica]|uniref:GNAT family N-acetyltransferase n=1 Tax=Longirhabdus pacifica TaxID=2305227 RepID=UPI0010092C8B|nr:GNAT family N-acetyltransferase [Longirhabdus pacifica]
MKIREITIDDVDSFIQVQASIEGETDYMLFGANERHMSKQKGEKFISSFIASSHSTLLVAEENNRILGFLLARGGASQRSKHAVYIVIGILQAYGGKGIGTALFRQLEAWSKQQGVARWELTVQTRNETAVALYKKVGFEIEGTKKKSLFIHKQYEDEYMMSKLFV